MPIGPLFAGRLSNGNAEPWGVALQTAVVLIVAVIVICSIGDAVVVTAVTVTPVFINRMDNAPHAPPEPFNRILTKEGVEFVQRGPFQGVKRRRALTVHLGPIPHSNSRDRVLLVRLVPLRLAIRPRGVRTANQVFTREAVLQGAHRAQGE